MTKSPKEQNWLCSVGGRNAMTISRVDQGAADVRSYEEGSYTAL